MVKKKNTMTLKEAATAYLKALIWDSRWETEENNKKNLSDDNSCSESDTTRMQVYRLILLHYLIDPLIPPHCSQFLWFHSTLNIVKFNTLSINYPRINWKGSVWRREELCYNNWNQYAKTWMKKVNTRYYKKKKNARTAYHALLLFLLRHRQYSKLYSVERQENWWIADWRHLARSGRGIFEVQSQYISGKKITKIKTRIFGVPVEITTVNLSNTSSGRYRYITLLGGIAYHKYTSFYIKKSN
jgi:hypothetical protein